MFKNSVFLFTILAATIVSAQEIKIFNVKDFDLKGKVKSCLVITDYGKEEYHFNKEGLLTKSTTRYNDTDYETTYYKYTNGELAEKRVENYRDDTFDSATSIANFYSIDTLKNRKVTEKIVSYEKELLEQNIFYYDNEGKLVRIEKTDTDGIDESTFEYNETDDETTVIHKRNGVLFEKIQTTIDASENDSLQKTVVTQKYLDGLLNTKNIEVYGGRNELLSEIVETYDSSTEKWIPQKNITYVYTDDGVLEKTLNKRGAFTSTKAYIYQFDGTVANNWVKEIITPDNTYTTRRIDYYELPVEKEPQKE